MPRNDFLKNHVLANGTLLFNRCECPLCRNLNFRFGAIAAKLADGNSGSETMAKSARISEERHRAAPLIPNSA